LALKSKVQEAAQTTRAMKSFRELGVLTLRRREEKGRWEIQLTRGRCQMLSQGHLSRLTPRKKEKLLSEPKLI